MKRRILIALAVGVLLSLTSFAIPAQKDAPARRVFIADTGIVSLGPDEVPRLSCVARDGSATTTLGFRRLEYAQGPCNSGVCTHIVGSDHSSGPVMLMPGEGATFVDSEHRLRSSWNRLEQPSRCAGVVHSL